MLWVRYDINMHLAGRYKLFTKLGYLILLVTGVVVVVMTVFASGDQSFNATMLNSTSFSRFVSWRMHSHMSALFLCRRPQNTMCFCCAPCRYQLYFEFVRELFQGTTLWRSLTLMLALLLTTMLGIIGFFTPGMRWKQLRASAMELQSIIWKHRTRCSIIKDGANFDDVSPEKSLCHVRTTV